MGNLRWLPDEQFFALEGVSIYHIVCAEAQNPPGNIDRLTGFLERLLQKQEWKTYRSERMLRTWVRLVSLGPDQWARGRVGIADVSPAKGSVPLSFGLISVETKHPDEAREVAMGVERLHRFIKGHDVPLVCEVEIWMKDKPGGGFRLDEIFVTLPFEDELYRAFHNYPSALYSLHDSETDADSAKALCAISGCGKPPECKCEVEWDGHSLVTIPLPGNPAFGVEANGDHGRVSAHFQQLTDPGEDYIPLVLIPRPDNELDQKAVSIALPRAAGGSVQERHLAYLSHDYLGDSLGALIADLARFSGGEIQFQAETVRDLPWLEVDPQLPPSRAFAQAIGRFLEDATIPPVESRPGLTTLLGVTERRGLPQRTVTLRGKALSSITTFEKPFADENDLEVETGAEKYGHPNLTIISRRSAKSSRTIGRIEAGLLILKDERQRERVTPQLAGIGVRFAGQTRPYPVSVSEEFKIPASAVPNMGIRLHPACYRFEIRSSYFSRRSRHVAEYNPRTQKLWIEDEAIAEAVCRYAARLGLQVQDVGFPRNPWHLEEQVEYRLRSDRFWRS